MVEKLADDSADQSYLSFLNHLAIKLACDSGFFDFSLSSLGSLFRVRPPGLRVVI